MEITGKILQILPTQSGEGKNGPWQKQDFVIETFSDYPKTVCFTTWNNRVELDKMSVGEKIKVFFDAESREYNGKWYTNLNAWRSETLGAPNGSSAATPQQEIVEEEKPFNEFTDDGDLPF